MKKHLRRALPLLLASALLTVLFAACGEREESSSALQSETQSNTEQINTETSLPEDSTASEESSEPEEDEPASELEQALQLERMYQALAEAAGLTDAVDLDELDLAMSGGVDTSTILSMVARQTKYAGDSGLVMVLYVEPGTAEDMASQLAGFRDSFLSGPNYEEFEEAQAATEQARIVADGDYVVYAVISVRSGASVEALDAAIEALFE